MATRLARAVVRLSVWNRSSAPLAALAGEGARVAQSAAELFADSDVVILMLANEAATDAVLGRSVPADSQAHGLLRVPLAGRIVVNTGTVSPQYSQALSRDVLEAGGAYVEAPVSGSRVPAEQGKLVGMLAGEAAAIESVQPLLAHLCADTFLCGAVGNALIMKLAVNTYLITLVTGLAESFSFARKHGLDLVTLRAVLDAGQMASPISRVKTEKLASQDMSPQASITDVLMNCELIVAAATRAGATSPLLTVCRDLYAKAKALGVGGLDMVALGRAIEEGSAGGARRS